MGLFDFLKPKPDQAGQPAPAANPAANPAADAGNDPAAGPPKTGPRYQGANFVAPAEPVAPAPQAPLPPPFEPENVLEQLLLLAPTDEAARPAFYQALLREDILMVLAPGEDQATGEVQLAEGQQIQLQVLQDGRLPIFTSAARLADGGTDASLISYVRLPGHAFFSMTQGQDCVLNPFSPAGKLLPADEITALLARQLAPGGPGGPEGLPPDAQVTLSAPAELPAGLADALRAFGQGHATIRAIYLAQMQLVAGPGQPPRLLLGFDTTDQNPDFLPELGPALEGRTGGFQHVDLMLVDLTSDEGVNPYFRLPEVEPVYFNG